MFVVCDSPSIGLDQTEDLLVRQWYQNTVSLRDSPLLKGVHRECSQKLPVPHFHNNEQVLSFVDVFMKIFLFMIFVNAFFYMIFITEEKFTCSDLNLIANFNRIFQKHFVMILIFKKFILEKTIIFETFKFYNFRI